MEAAIKKGSEKWMTFYKKGDFKSLAKLYTPDCQVYPPGQPMATGREGKSSKTPPRKDTSCTVKYDNVL